MTGLSAADMTGMEGCIDSFMPNTVTNGRTGVQIPCRVSFDKAQISRLEGVAFWEHTPKWGILVPLLLDGVPVDVQLGDRLTEPIKGTYALIEVESPDSYAVSIDTWGALLHPTAGTIIVPNVPAVTFIRGTQSVTLPVYIRDVSTDLVLRGEVPAFDWSVAFDPQMAIYGDGTTVGANDKIQWSGLGTTSQGTARIATLSKPRPQIGPITYSVALFKEMP
jgi:hypothetical protein